MNLNELTKEIHENSIKHGWWDEPRSFAEVVALCHSELSEALEEDRENNPNEYFLYEMIFEPSEVRETDMSKWDGEKTEGKAVEMADCIIRILDWFGKEGVNAEEVIMRKHEYNKTRPYKHGKKY